MQEQAVMEKDFADRMPSDDDLLSLNEARSILGVGVNKIYNLVNSGEIPHVAGISGKKIRRGTLHNYIMEHEVNKK
jgi:predicted DNA-binding transcriptional regulator AlpA